MNEQEPMARLRATLRDRIERITRGRHEGVSIRKELIEPLFEDHELLVDALTDIVNEQIDLAPLLRGNHRQNLPQSGREVHRTLRES